MAALPTLKQLRYLCTLRDHLHFSKAAEACHVTQSTLSAGIQELEALLGAPLVERNRKTVLFTDLGEKVVTRAREILVQAEALVDLTQAAQEPLTGTIRLGIIPTVAPFLLPDVLPVLRHRFPSLKLMLREQTSALLCDQLKHGSLDLVLYALPFSCGEVEEMPLFDDKFLAAFPPGTDELPPKISSDRISQETLLLLEEGHCLRDHALAACSLTHVDADRAILGTSLHTLVQMVANGLGTTLLPQMAVDGGILANTGIRTVPLADQAPARTIGLIWRKNSPRAAEYHLLGEALQQWHAGKSAKST